MIGRYGADELAKHRALLHWYCFFVDVSRLGIFIWLAIALMIYSTWRMFSKNISARYAENQKYLNYRYQMAVKWNRFKKHLAQRKNYRFYKCPQCKQKVRVPKGRGKICITCPKCRTEFVKKRLKIKGDFSIVWLYQYQSKRTIGRK
mgnify:CR=1 FL=1